MKSSHPRSRSGQRGIALVEALVAILIFAFGIVGLVGMQAAMTRAQGTAKSRADASYLASLVLGKMWADRANLSQYSTSGGCSSYQPCKDWTDKVAATLPAARAAIWSDLGDWHRLAQDHLVHGRGRDARPCAHDNHQLARAAARPASP